MTLELNLQKGLVGHWTMDGRDFDSGSIRDKSAYGNHGSATSGLTFGEQAKVETGVLFSDTSGEEIVISPISSSAITLSCWYRYDGLGNNSWNTLLGDGNAGEHHILIKTDGSGEIGFYNHTFYGSGYELSVGEWYHIVTVKSETQQKVYVDASLKLDSTDSFDNSASDNAFEIIGNYEPGGDQSALGIMDEVRAYSRELSESEIDLLYNMRSQRNASI